MTNDLDHVRCSELLPAFVDGTLAPGDAAWVQSHLAGCGRCRAEQAGLEGLTRGDQPPMTATERSMLEERVMRRIGEAGDDVDVVVPITKKRNFGAKVAGALGAAAVVAVIATFAYLGTSGGTDEAGMGTAVSEEAESFDADGAGGGDRRGRAGTEEALSADGGDAAAGGTATQDKAGVANDVRGAEAPPQPTFKIESDGFTGEELEKRGASSLESVRFAAFYNTSDRDSSSTLLEQLVNQAEDVSGPEIADQVEECGGRVLDTDEPTIPTFGAVGELDGTDVLVLGFAWARSGNAYDRYMVWAWEQGDCDVAVDFVDGKIETAN